MPSVRFVASGSNTTVKSGEGQVYGAVVAGVNGATAFLVDSLSIGVTPNYITQLSDSSNIAVFGPVGAAGGEFSTYGAHFQDGLTVAVTSNANIAVYYD